MTDPQQAKATAAVLAKLRKAKVAFVVVPYEGYADEPMLGAPTFVPPARVRLTRAERDALEDLVWQQSEFLHPSWSADDGAVGLGVLDVANARVTVRHRSHHPDPDGFLKREAAEWK
jgi:hypothetical protein